MKTTNGIEYTRKQHPAGYYIYTLLPAASHTNAQKSIARKEIVSGDTTAKIVERNWWGSWK